jgi:hypothetical protein
MYNTETIMTATKALMAAATALALSACASPYDGNYAYSTDSYRYRYGWNNDYYASGYYGPRYSYYRSGYYASYPYPTYGPGVTIAASF